MASKQTPEPTEAELDSISEAANQLWDLDDNRLECGPHYRINLQSHKQVYQADVDAADEPLFEFVNYGNIKMVKWLKVTLSATAGEMLETQGDSKTVFWYFYPTRVTGCS